MMLNISLKCFLAMWDSSFKNSLLKPVCHDLIESFDMLMSSFWVLYTLWISILFKMWGWWRTFPILERADFSFGQCPLIEQLFIFMSCHFLTVYLSVCATPLLVLTGSVYLDLCWGLGSTWIWVLCSVIDMDLFIFYFILIFTWTSNMFEGSFFLSIVYDFFIKIHVPICI